MVTHEADEQPGMSGVLFSLAELERLEQRIAEIVAEALSVPEQQWRTWVADRFGPDYPSDLSPQEVAVDLVSHIVNDSSFSSTSRCPACARLALGPASGCTTSSATWSFFAPE